MNIKQMEINIDSPMYTSLIIYEQARAMGVKVAIHATHNTFKQKAMIPKKKLCSIWQN